MMLKQIFTSFSLALVLQSSTVAVGQCPPSGFDAVKDLELDKYVNGENWYSIQQIPVSYQPKEDFYCVSAKYNVDGPTVFCRLFGWAFGCSDALAISVFNYARRGSNSGRINSIGQLEAIIPDPDNDPAKLDVNFELIPRPFRGKSTNYWVVATGTYNELSGLENYESSTDEYEWAIITTGEPESEGNVEGLCYSSGGFWIFSRLPMLPDGALAAIEDIATGLGLDTSFMEPVEHEGCDYGGSSTIFDTVINLFDRIF